MDAISQLLESIGNLIKNIDFVITGLMALGGTVAYILGKLGDAIKKKDGPPTGRPPAPVDTGTCTCDPLVRIDVCKPKGPDVKVEVKKL